MHVSKKKKKEKKIQTLGGDKETSPHSLTTLYSIWGRKYADQKNNNNKQTNRKLSFSRSIQKYCFWSICITASFLDFIKITTFLYIYSHKMDRQVVSKALLLFLYFLVRLILHHLNSRFLNSRFCAVYEAFVRALLSLLSSSPPCNLLQANTKVKCNRGHTEMSQEVVGRVTRR